MTQSAITLTINGSRHDVLVEPRRTLVDVIREDCGLTGTHVGCEHGVCGACTILVDGAPVRSCLMFGVQADGADIRTVEGLSRGAVLSTLQVAFTRHHALQCGYCTPGFLMLLTGVFAADPDLDDESLRDIIASNICRCTGYENILLAARSALRDLRAAHE